MCFKLPAMVCLSQNHERSLLGSLIYAKVAEIEGKCSEQDKDHEGVRISVTGVLPVG